MTSKMIRGVVVAFAAAAVFAASATSAAAADRRVVVVNDTNHTMTNLYASSVRDSRYHGDWLGRSVLRPGESMVVDFNDGSGACLMDVKGVFSDHTSATNRYNVCRGSEMDFTGN
ncbi:hypothetical protein ACO2Q3_22505 [Caulobacter sp. KR2-114]|uniref:hypothetical protein n=1 Tax=Caulobacter sp. KR2-114 TaxID=3400912 RepID=UPI003C0A3854